MHHAGIQYGQAPMSATAHPQFNNVAELSVPSAAPSTTTSLRQWRKKEGGVAAAPEIKPPSLQNEPSGENQGPIARVAPHAHYPRPSEPYRYPQQPAPYENYGLGYKEPAPVKYSEIVEPVQAPPHRIEHAPLQAQKPKEKEYLEMCSMQQQMKHGYAMLPQYNIQKESQMYIPNYHLPNCKIPPNYHQRQYGNDGFHLALYERQEQQIYMEQQRVAYQNQRMYRPQFHPNYRNQYNYPNYKPNIQSDPYRMHPYQQMQNYKIPPHLDAVRNLSPRRVYHETYPRVSPNYNQCSQLEYAQHYQNRRQIPTDYLTHQQMQNHQMPDLVTDATPKSSLKQFLETWNDDIPEIQDGSKKDDNLYILDSTEIPTESIQQFIHLQVDKLPENIKGFIAPSTSVQGVIRENEVLNLTQDTVIRSQQPSVISETKKFLEIESQKVGNASLDLLQNTVIVYNENSEKNEGVIRENFKKNDIEATSAIVATSTKPLEAAGTEKAVKSNISKEAMPCLETREKKAEASSTRTSIVTTKCGPISSATEKLKSEAEAATVLKETICVEDMPSITEPSKCLADMPPIEDSLAEDLEMQISTKTNTDSFAIKDDIEKGNLLEGRETVTIYKGSQVAEDLSDEILDYTREKLLSDTRDKLLEYSPNILENLREKFIEEANEKIIGDATETIVGVAREKAIEAKDKIIAIPKEKIVVNAKRCKTIEEEGKQDEVILRAPKDSCLVNTNKTDDNAEEKNGRLIDNTSDKLYTSQQLPQDNILLNSKSAPAEITKDLVSEELIEASQKKITMENKCPEALKESTQMSSLKQIDKLPEATTISALKPAVKGGATLKIDLKSSQPIEEIPTIELGIEQKSTQNVTDISNKAEAIQSDKVMKTCITEVTRRSSINEITSEDSMDTSTSGEDTFDLTSSEENSCASPAYNSIQTTFKQEQDPSIKLVSVNAETHIISRSSDEAAFSKSAFSSVTSSAIEKDLATSYPKASSNTNSSAATYKDISNSSEAKDVQILSAITTNSLPTAERASIISGNETASSNRCKSMDSEYSIEAATSARSIQSSNKSITFNKSTKLSKETLPTVPSKNIALSRTQEVSPEDNKTKQKASHHLGDNLENNKGKSAEYTEISTKRTSCGEPENNPTREQQLETTREKFLEDTREKYLANTREKLLGDESRVLGEITVKLPDDTKNFKGVAEERFLGVTSENLQADNENLLENTRNNLLDETNRMEAEKIDSKQTLLADTTIKEDTEKDLLEESTRAFNSEREELLRQSKRVRFVSEEPEVLEDFPCEENEKIHIEEDLYEKPEEIHNKQNEILADNTDVSCKRADENLSEINEVIEENLEKNSDAEDNKQSQAIKETQQGDNNTFEEKPNEGHALNLSTKYLKLVEENQDADTLSCTSKNLEPIQSQSIEESKDNVETQLPNTQSEFEELRKDSVNMGQVEKTAKTDIHEETKQLVANERGADETVETNDENITCANAVAVDENYVLLQIGGEILEINVINTMGRKIISVVPFTDCTVVTENNNEAGIVNLEGEEVLYLEEDESPNKEVGALGINLEQEKIVELEDNASGSETVLEKSLLQENKSEESALKEDKSTKDANYCEIETQLEVKLKDPPKSKLQDEQEDEIIIIEDESLPAEEENVILEENIILGGEHVVMQEENIIIPEESVIFEEESVILQENEISEEDNVILPDNITLDEQNEDSVKEKCEENKTKIRRSRRRSQQDNIEENNSMNKNQTTEQAVRQEEEDYKIVESEDNKIVLKRRRKSTPKALAWEEDRKARIARNRIAKKEADCDNIKTRSKTLKENKKLTSIEERLEENISSNEIIDDVNENIIECDIINEIEIEEPSTPKSDIPILSVCPPLINSPLINSPLINSPLINPTIINAPLFNPLLSNLPKLDKHLVVVLKPEDEIPVSPSLRENSDVESPPPIQKLDKRLVVVLKPEDEVKVAKHIRKLKAAKRPLRRIQSYKDYIRSKEKKEAKKQNEEESAYSKTKKNFSIISRDRRMKIKSPSSRNKKSPFEDEKKVTFKDAKDIIETKDVKEGAVKEAKGGKCCKEKPKVKTKAELKDTSPAKPPLKSILKKSKQEEPDSPKKKLSLEEYINRTRVDDGKNDSSDGVDKSKIEKIASKLDKIRILQGRKEEKKVRSDEEDSIIKALRKMEEESSGNIFEDIAQTKSVAEVEDASAVLKPDKIEAKLDRFDKIEVKTDRFEAKADRFEAKTDIFEVNSAFTSPLKQYQKKKPVECIPHNYGDIKQCAPHYSDITPLYNEIAPSTPQYSEARYPESLSHYNIVSPHYIEMAHYSYKDPRCFKEGYCNKDPRKKDNYCQEVYGENHYPNVTYNSEIMPPQYNAQYNEVMSPYNEVTSPYSEAAPQYNVHHYNEHVNYNAAMPQYGEYREVAPHYGDANYNYGEVAPISSENSYTELKPYYSKVPPHYNSENKHHFKEYSEEFTSQSKSPKKERRSSKVPLKYSDPRISETEPRRNSDSKLPNRENHRITTSQPEVAKKHRLEVPEHNLEVSKHSNESPKQKLESRQETAGKTKHEDKQNHEDKQRQKEKQKLEDKPRPEEWQRVENEALEARQLMEDKNKPDDKLEGKQNLEACNQNLEASKQNLEASVVSPIKEIEAFNTEALSNVEASTLPVPIKETCNTETIQNVDESSKILKTNIQASAQEAISDTKNNETKTVQIGEENNQEAGMKANFKEPSPPKSLKHQYLNSLGLYREKSPSPPLLEPETITTTPNEDKIEEAPPVLRKEVLDFGLEEDEEELDFEEDISSSWPSPSPSKSCETPVKVSEAPSREGDATKNKVAASETTEDGVDSPQSCDAKNDDLTAKDGDVKNGDASKKECDVETNRAQVQGPLDATTGSLPTNASPSTKSVFNEQKQIISDLNKKIDDIFTLTFRTSNYEDDLLKRFTNGERMAPGELLKVRNVIQRKNFKIQKPKAKNIINLDEISYRKTNVIDLNDFNLDVPLNKPKVKSIIDLNELLPSKAESKAKRTSCNEEDAVPTPGLKVLGQPRYTTKIYRLSEDVTTIPKKPKMPTLLPLSRKGRYDHDANEGRHQGDATNRRKYKRTWKNYQKDDKKELVKTTRNKSHIPIHPVWSRLQLSEDDGKGRNNRNSYNNSERSFKYCEDYAKEISRERRTKEESKLQETAKENKCQETPRIEESARGRKVYNENIKMEIHVSNVNGHEERSKNQDVGISQDIIKENIKRPEKITKNHENVQKYVETSIGCQENIQKCEESTINYPKNILGVCESTEIYKESTKNCEEDIQKSKESTKDCQEDITDSTNGSQGNIRPNNTNQSTKEIGEEQSVTNSEDLKVTNIEDKEKTEESESKSYVEGNIKESESINSESSEILKNRKIECEDLDALEIEESCSKIKIENVEAVRTEVASEEIKREIAVEVVTETSKIIESKETSITSEESSDDISIKRPKLSNFEDNEDTLKEPDFEKVIIAESSLLSEEMSSKKQGTLPNNNEDKFNGFEEMVLEDKLEEKMAGSILDETIVEDEIEERMDEDRRKEGIVQDKVEEEKEVEGILAQIHENNLQDDNVMEAIEDKSEEMQEDTICVENKKLNVLQNYVLKPKRVNLHFNEETNLEEHNSREKVPVNQHNKEETTVEDLQENNSVCDLVDTNAETNLNDVKMSNIESLEEKNCNPNEEYSTSNVSVNIEVSKFDNHSSYEEQKETNINSLQEEAKKQDEIRVDDSPHKTQETEMKHSSYKEEVNGQEGNEFKHSLVTEEEERNSLCREEIQYSSYKEDEHSIKRESKRHSVLWTNPKRERRSITVLKMMRRKKDADAEEILDITTPDEIENELNPNFNQEQISLQNSPQPKESTSLLDSQVNCVNFTSTILNSNSVRSEESTSHNDSPLNYTKQHKHISKVHHSNPYFDSQPEESMNLCHSNLCYLDVQPESPKILNLSTKCDDSNRRESIIISNKILNSIDESVLPIDLCCNSSKNISRDLPCEQSNLKLELNVEALNLKHEEKEIRRDESKLNEVKSLKQDSNSEQESLKHERSKLDVEHEKSIKLTTLPTDNDLNLLLYRQPNFASDSSSIPNSSINFSALNELNRRSQMSLLSKARCESNRNLYYKNFQKSVTSINRRPYLESFKTESARRRRESKNYKSKIRVNMINNENNNSHNEFMNEPINNSKIDSNTNSDSPLNFIESVTRRHNTVIKFDDSKPQSANTNKIDSNAGIQVSGTTARPSNANITESNTESPESNTKESRENIPQGYFKFGNSIESNSNIFHTNNLARNNTTLTPIPRDSQNKASIPLKRRKSIFDSIQILSTGEPSSLDIISRFNDSSPTVRVNSAVNTPKHGIELDCRVSDGIKGTKQESPGDIQTSVQSRPHKVNEESNIFRSVPILPAEVPSSVDISGLEAAPRVNSVFKISEEITIDPIVDSATNQSESIEKVANRISHESSGTGRDSTSDLQNGANCKELQNKSCDLHAKKSCEEKSDSDSQRSHNSDYLHGSDERSPSVFNEELSICENVEVTSCDLKPRQLRKIPELVAIDRAKFMNPLRKVRKVHSALPVPSEGKRVRFEEPARKKSIDDISRKLMDICKDNICKPEYESVPPNDDLKLHLKKVKKSRKRKRFRNLHAASSDEEADYSVFESKNPKGLPKLIIKRNVVEVREHFQPIVRIERDPKLDSMAKRKRKC